MKVNEKIKALDKFFKDMKMEQIPAWWLGESGEKIYDDRIQGLADDIWNDIITWDSNAEKNNCFIKVRRDGGKVLFHLLRGYLGKSLGKVAPEIELKEEYGGE